MKKRNSIIDIAKGIGIALVILGHITDNSDCKQLIYMFHMPLFFFISGISFKYSYTKDSSFKKFFRKKIKSIMIPYFIFL